MSIFYYDHDSELTVVYDADLDLIKELCTGLLGANNAANHMCVINHSFIKIKQILP